MYLFILLKNDFNKSSKIQLVKFITFTQLNFGLKSLIFTDIVTTELDKHTNIYF